MRLEMDLLRHVDASVRGKLETRLCMLAYDSGTKTEGLKGTLCRRLTKKGCTIIQGPVGKNILSPGLYLPVE